MDGTNVQLMLSVTQRKERRATALQQLRSCRGFASRLRAVRVQRIIRDRAGDCCASSGGVGESVHLTRFALSSSLCRCCAANDRATPEVRPPALLPHPPCRRTLSATPERVAGAGGLGQDSASTQRRHNRPARPVQPSSARHAAVVGRILWQRRSERVPDQHSPRSQILPLAPYSKQLPRCACGAAAAPPPDACDCVRQRGMA